MPSHRLAFLACACFAFALVQTAEARPPKVFWVSDPVKPGQTAVVFGDSLGPAAKLTIAAPGQAPVAPDALQTSDVCLKIAIPTSMPAGVLRLRIATGEGQTSAWVNRPTILWLQGDQGPNATPGGFVRLLGRCFTVPGMQPTVRLAGPGGSILLKPRKADLFDAQADLPKTLAPGEYKVTESAGPGGAAGWSEPAVLRVEAKRAANKQQFDPQSYGAKGDGKTDDTPAIQKALAAAGAAGGGSVRLPRGRYLLSATLDVPVGVMLKGESETACTLGWVDSDKPLEALIRGTHDFTISDLAIYATNHLHGIVSGRSGPEVGNVRVLRVRMRLNPFRGHITQEAAAQRLAAKEKFYSGGGDALRLAGKNVEVAYCDVVAGGRSLSLAKCQGAWIHDNRFGNGRWGWYSIGKPDGLIFERNNIYAADLMSTGGSLNILEGPGCSQNVYFADNAVAGVLGWDREALTTDAPGGTYYGRAASADDRRLVLATDPQWGGMDWAGCGVFILGGTGQGQHRQIVAAKGREVTLDRPWDVPPDSTSVLSVAELQRRFIIVRNRMEEAGVAIQFFGVSVEGIAAWNTSEHTGGFVNIAMDYYGKQPSWYTQWLENRIAEGDAYSGGNQQAVDISPPSLRVSIGGPETPPPATLNLCTVIRGNVLAYDSFIDIGNYTTFPYTQDVLIEGNTVKGSDVGIRIQTGVLGVLLVGNHLLHCAKPLDMFPSTLQSGAAVVK